MSTPKISDDEDKITAYISTSGMEENINAIGGELSYNKNYMTLSSVETASSEWIVRNNEDKFIALRKETTKLDEEVIKLTFEII